MKKWTEHHRKKLLYGCSLIIIVSLLFGIMLIPVFKPTQFAVVIEYVNNGINKYIRLCEKSLTGQKKNG